MTNLLFSVKPELIRIAAAFLTSLTVFLLFAPEFIKKIKNTFRQNFLRKNLPESHKKKEKTPTMAGLLIIFSIIISTLIWSKLYKAESWLILICLIGFGAIGLWDDLKKLRSKTGITVREKFKLQILLALVIAIIWSYTSPTSTTTLQMPLFKNLQFDIGTLFIFWTALVIISTSNAVNLSDGIDGLAVGSLIPNFALFSIIAFLTSTTLITPSLQIASDGIEIAIIGAAIIGASLGFLMYNKHPAKIFMGDVGSLSLGATLGLIALLLKKELILPISGAIFVTETLSVIIQHFYFKKYRKRFFKITPIHHHFELSGWSEQKITKRFTTITISLCILTLLAIISITCF